MGMMTADQAAAMLKHLEAIEKNTAVTRRAIVLMAQRELLTVSESGEIREAILKLK